ncbi:MAG: tetratricopeptide repeat protein, partial [Tannerellaceae bacterium]|nr:tetratricopeptide repeat protein [Tannerellaceae bacterium]
MKKKFVTYILFLPAIFLLFSCKSAKLSDAEEKQRIGEYNEAAAIYRKVFAKTPPKDRAMRGYIAFRMADCNRLINNTSRATSAYMNALRYNYPDSMVNLRLGQMYQKGGKYNDAVKYYTDFLSVNPVSVLAGNGVKGSEVAPAWRQSPTRYQVKRMDKFNSKRSEFSPMLSGANYDQLYFASSRTKDKEAA